MNEKVFAWLRESSSARDANNKITAGDAFLKKHLIYNLEAFEKENLCFFCRGVKKKHTYERLNR